MVFLGALNNQTSALSAAVLAGGKSRRMGRDKAFLPIGIDGQPMLSIVLERLRDIADDLMIVANDRERYAEFDERVVSDREGGGGALAGIEAAIASAAHGHVLVVACDMPFLSPDLLRRMAGEVRDYDVLVPLLQGQSRQSQDGTVFQTLHAIYGKACLGPIRENLNAGRRQVIGFYPAVRVRMLEQDEIAQWDPELMSFYNANTPEAYAFAVNRMSWAEPS